MIGVPLVGPTDLLGDNMSVIVNTTLPSSQLKKKHNAIAYHRIREAVAAGIIRFGHIGTDSNIADCMTKALEKPKMNTLLKQILFRQSPHVHGSSENTKL